MTTTDKYITSTIILDFLIVIGAGHGIGVLGMVGILWFPNIITGEFNFVFFGEYDESLAANALFSTIGQIVFLIALFRRKGKNIRYLILTGATLMLVSFISLTHTVAFDLVATISLLSGIPFLISLSILLLRTIGQKDAM